MTEHRTIVENVLEIVAGRADAEVFVDVGESSLTRFANSFIHQNVSEVASTVTLRVATEEGRVASSTATSTTPDGLQRLVDTTLEVAAGQPSDDDWPGFGGPVDQPQVDHWDAATAAADPVARAEAVKAFVDAGSGLSAAGYCQTEARHQAYGNTAGRTATGRYTTAVLDGIHQTDGSAGSAHAAGVALDGSGECLRRQL